MANPIWPNIQNPSFPLKEDPEDAVIRTEFDAGYEQTRPRFTRNRTTYSLEWPAMKGVDLAALLTFYKTTLANGAAIFDWTYPGTSTVHAARFKSPPKVTQIASEIYHVECEIREV